MGGEARHVIPAVPGISGLTLIARGGYGAVYRGVQTNVDREVAVKITWNSLDTDRERSRFLREARAAGRMSSHPHVIDLFDAGVTADGHPYLVMELCPESYAEIMERRPITVQEARDVGYKIADALAEAHERGIVHGDVKPANILITRFQEPALSDFGLAVLSEDREADVSWLTPAYAPPELFRRGERSPASDVYSLCATLYALLAKAPPRWRSEQPLALASLVELFSEPVPDIPGVPVSMTDVLRRGMSNDSVQRPTVRELHYLLAELDLSRAGTTAPRPDRAPALHSTQMHALSVTRDRGRTTYSLRHLLADDPDTGRAWPASEVAVVVLVDLPVEAAAMARLMHHSRTHTVDVDRQNYRLGSLPSADPGHAHRLALAVRPRDGTSAESFGARLLRAFPNMQCLIMVGIAAGIPRSHPRLPDIRLGDVVVATEGVVDYDQARQPHRTSEHISAPLVRAANLLRMGELSGHRPWEHWLDPRSGYVSALMRPHEGTAGRSAIHSGAIASADVLSRREAGWVRLGEQFDDLVAVEGEGSGIAGFASTRRIPWLMVRGIADYGEVAQKDDTWTRYSALAAAAYVRALLAVCEPFVPAAPRPVLQPVRRAVRVWVDADSLPLGPGETVTVRVGIGPRSSSADGHSGGEITVVLLVEDADVAPGARQVMLDPVQAPPPIEFELTPRRSINPELRILIFSTAEGVLLQELRAGQTQVPERDWAIRSDRLPAGLGDWPV